MLWKKSNPVYGLCIGRGLWAPGTVCLPVTRGKQAHKPVPVTQLHMPRLFICLTVTVQCFFRSVCECMCG